MIRKNKNALRPLYRDIVPSALQSAWQDRWLWPFAIVASLLHTGGIYDTILMTMRHVRRFGSSIMSADVPVPIEQAWLKVTGAAGIMPAIGSIQSILFALVFVGAILGLAVICQGALVFGLGGRVRGRRPQFQECLTVGAREFGKILVLNLITLGLIWLGKFFMILPWSRAVAGSEVGMIALFIGTSLLYMVLVVALTAIHFFALNAIILQEAHVTEALEHGVQMLKQGWLAVLELALILFLFGAAVLGAGFLAFTMAGIPIVLVIMAAALLGQTGLVTLGWSVATILFFVIILTAGGFTVTFQFAAWHRLFLRLGEGGVVSKIHRWMHAFLKP